MGYCILPPPIRWSLHAARAARPLFALAALLLLVRPADPALATVVTIQPSRGSGVDTYVKSGSDSLRNYGADDILVVSDENKLHRTLLWFDLSSFGPDDGINSATLDLYLDKSAGPGASVARIGVYEALRAWTEGTGKNQVVPEGATWMRARSGVNWTAPGGDFDADAAAALDVPEVEKTWYSWEITSLVQGWAADSTQNRGLLLKLVTETPGENIKREFVSNDRNDPPHLPRLTIDVDPGGMSAVDSARAEIVPDSVVAATLTPFVYSIRTFFTPGQNGGVNAVQIPLGTGFRLGAVTSVLVDDVPWVFVSASDSLTIRLGFTAKVVGSRRIDIAFTATAPQAASVQPLEFTSSVDDASTPFPANAAVEGSANVDPLDGDTWAVVVLAQPPVAIRILPDSASVSADSTLDFNAVAIGVLGDTTAIDPVWSVAGGVGTIDSTGLFAAGTAGIGRIVATYVPPVLLGGGVLPKTAAALVDSAPVIVYPGVPATADVAPDTATVSADSTKQFTATIRDADGNVVATAPTWTVSGGVGSVSATGLFTAATAGSGFVRAAAGAARDSARVTVVPGTPASVTVTPDPVTVSADTTQPFAATVQDADGNAVPVLPTWSVLGGIGSVNASGLFTATTSGIGFVRAVAGAARDSAQVTVVPGQAVTLDVAPDTATVSADSTEQFAAVARDADGNVTPAAILWTTRGGVGIVSSTGLFTATTAGSGWVIATAPASADTHDVGGFEDGTPKSAGPPPSDSARVTVVPGSLARLVVSPDPVSVTADSSLAFTASGFDGDGNALGAVAADWKVLGPVGTIDDTGLFDAVGVGTGGVVATGPGGAPADTAQVSVSPGAMVEVRLTPVASILSPGETIQFTLIGYDKDENPIAIPRASVAWSTTDPTGSISSQGLYTAGTTLSPPAWEVRGTYSGLSATALVTVISSGALARIEIEDTLGAAVGALAVTADDDGLVLRATGYGPGGEALGPVSCAWSVIGSAAVAQADSGPDIETAVDFALAGSVRIRAEGPAGLADTTGVVTVSPGALAAIAVSPGPITVTTDTTLAFTAAPRDADGNVVAGGTIAWSVLSGIGTIDAATGLFDPRTPGTGAVRASSSLGPSGDSPAITVVPGALASLAVSPSSAVVPRGGTRAFSAAGADADGNAVALAPSWSVLGAIGTIDSTGLFAATGGGSGRVVATAGDVSDSASVTVTEAGLPRLLSVRAPRLTVTAGQPDIPLALRIRNETAATLVSFTPLLAPRDPQGGDLSDGVAVASVVAPDSVAPGAEGTITVTVDLEPPLAAGTQVILDASLLAESGTGAAFYDSTADTTGAWIVQAPPRLLDAENSVWPRRVTSGAGAVSFLLGGWNEGGVAVDLDADATRLVVGQGPSAYVSTLAAGANLTADSTLAVLSFDGALVPAGLAPGVYPLTIVAAGTDANGKAYAETLDTTDRNEVTVIPPYVTVSAAPVAAGPVRPGQPGAALLALDLENGYASAKTLSSITVANATAGPGSAAERDAEVAAVALHWDRDGDAALSAADTLLASAAFATGRADLGPMALVLPAEATVRLLVTGTVGLAARDGDSLDVALAASGDLAFSGAVTVDGAFPANSAGRPVVDGSTAAQFSATPVVSRAVSSSESLVTALDVILPANGYQPDTLRALSVAQSGSATAGADIARVRLARRGAEAAASGGGAPRSATLADSALGEMVWTGARWGLTGLAVPIPAGGLRVAVLVDLAPGATVGRTVSLSLPAGEGAVSVASGNDGPIDTAVAAGGTLTVASPDRIFVSSAAIATADLPQGAEDLPLLALALANGYAAPRTLASVRLAASASLLDTARLDSLLGSVSLWRDTDQDGALGAADSLLASGALSGGSVLLGGLGLALPPGATTGLVVAGTVSRAARDGDSLALRLASESDLSLSPASVVSGAFPATSTGLLPVSGMTRAAVTNHGAPPRTLVPGEEGVLVLDVTIPPNGYEPDTLRSLRVENAGTAAGATDVAALRLHRDGGDGTFDEGGGDDLLIGSLSFAGSGWLLEGLALPLPAAGARLFVAADVGESPRDSATIAVRIPTGGIAVATANDGPIDAAVGNPFVQTISTSPLVVSVTADRAEASVGQVLPVRLAVRNVGERAIEGIAPSLDGPSGSGAASLTAGPSPDSLRLDPGGAGEFVWMLRADSPGTVAFTGSARGRDAETGDLVSATPIGSPPLAIVNPPSSLTLFPTDLAPPTAARGVQNLVPLAITFSASGPPPSAGVEVRTLALRLEDGEGDPVSAAALLSRVRVREAGTLFHTEESFGDSATVPLVLSSPVRVTPEDPVTVALALDLRADTQVSAFRLAIASEAAIGAADANSSAPVAVALDPRAGAFPVHSGTVLVTETPSELLLSVGEERLLGDAVNRGQAGVRPLRLHLRAVGDSTIATDVRVVDLAFAVLDSAGGADDPAVLARVSVSDERLQYADDVSPLLTEGALRVPLATPLLLPVNAEVAVDVVVEIAQETPLGAIRFRLDADHLPTARDAATGDGVPVTLAEPFTGRLLRIESRPAALLAAPRIEPGRAVYPGTAGVPLLGLALRHPGAAGDAGGIVSSLAVRLTDDLGNPEPIGARLLSLSAARGETMIGGVNVAESGAPVATLPFTVPVVLSPGDSAEIAIRATVRGVANPGRIRLWIDAGGIAAGDANEGAAVAVAAEEAPFPFGSAILAILAPPADPIASFRDRAPATVARGAAAVPIASLRIANPDGPDAGPIAVEAIHFACAGRTGAPLDPRGIFSAARAVPADARKTAGGAVAAVVPAAASPADGGRLHLVVSPPQAIAPGETLALEIEADLVAAPEADAFRLSLADTDVVIARPGQGIDAPTVRAAPGESFPFATALVGIAEPEFGASLSNYPNPFAAGREPTRFVFFLAEPASVDLAVFTALGEPVASVASGVRAGPGMVDPIAWDGRNADGETVLSGVYLAEIRVRYDSGRVQAALRKVAVLR